MRLSGRNAIDRAALVAGIEVAVGSAECEHGSREPRQERCRLAAVRRNRYDNRTLAEAAVERDVELAFQVAQPHWRGMGRELDERLRVDRARPRGRRTGREAVVRATLDREEVIARAMWAEVVLIEIGDDRQCAAGQEEWHPRLAHPRCDAGDRTRFRIDGHE